MAGDYQDPRWQKKRLEVMQRDGFSCVCCLSTTEALNVHHMEYAGELWESPSDQLQTLCRSCHESLGKHPKGGLWWERSDKEVCLVVKHCPICASGMLIAGRSQEAGKTGVYGRCECGWNTSSHTIPPKLTALRVLLELRCSKRLTEEQHSRLRQDDEVEKKVRGYCKALERESRRLRADYRFTDSDIWALAFPEMPVPFGVTISDDGSFKTSTKAAEIAALVSNCLNAGMSCEELSLELAGFQRQQCS